MRFVTDILAKANLVVDGSVTLTTTPNASVDTDRFLVQDGTVVKYRTGSEVLSDIGAQGALTLTTTGTSGPATLVGNTLNIPQYQAVLTNPVTGTGILNYVARWTSTSAIGTGILYDDGSVVCVNATSPEYTEKLRVVGGVTFQHAYTQNNALERVGTVSGLTTTTAGGAAYYPGIAYTSIAGYHENIFNGSVTIPNSVGVGGISSIATLRFNASSVSVTMTQGSSFRAYSAVSGSIAFSTSQTGGSVSHVASFHALAPYYVGSNTPTITNYYGLLLNDTTEYSTWVAITNRWGVYQAGSSDKNHFNGRVLIGTTTDAGFLLNVNGDALINSVRVGRGNYNYLLNVAVGYNALNVNLSGAQVTAIGAGALQSNTTGSYNTALGYNSLYTNTSGQYNTGLGFYALNSNSSGSNNTAIGRSALESNTGSENTAVGSETSKFNTTGTRNTAVGNGANAYISTGSNNTALGYQAGRDAVNIGQFNQTPSNSLYLGYQTRAGGNGNNTNEVVIGASTDGNGSNTVTIGNTSITNTYLRGQLNIATINNATTDTDRFLVSDSGVVKYRTGAEVLSDIGAQAALTNPVTGTGTINYIPRFTGTSAIGDSGLYYAQGANFNSFNFGDLVAGAIYANTLLNLFSNNESAIYLQFGSNKYAQLSNEFGNVYLGASNSGIHGYNDIFFYNGSSVADRYLAFQTESIDRLTIEQNGDIQLNKYTSNGFVKTSNGNGTIIIDTTSYQPLLTNPVTGTGVSGQVAYFNGTSTITGESNLFWDASNDRLGIGTNTPASSLHINNSIGSAVNLITMQTGFDNPSGNKSIVWTDATNVLGRISVSYSAPKASMSFGSLFNSGYQTSDLMTLTADGNLGLGVTPSAWFSDRRAFQIQSGGSVNGSASTPSFVELGANFFHGSGGDTYISTTNASKYRQLSGAHEWYTAPSGTAGNAITFTQAMTLSSAGYLGIGSISPYGQLTIQNITNNLGGLNFTEASDGSSRRWQIRNDVSVFGDFSIRQSTTQTGTTFTDRLYISSTGAVGIGTTNPNTQLHVAGSLTVNDIVYLQRSSSSLMLPIANYWNGSGSPLAGTKGDILAIGNAGGDGLVFVNSNTERMRISSAGNVGIGNSSPATRLHVVSTGTGTEVETLRLDMDTSAVPTSAGLNFRFGSVNGATIYGVGENGSTGASSMRFYTHSGTSSAERMRITSGGNVGIGTTNTASALSGSARVLAIVDNATANVGSVRVYGAGTATSLELYGGSSEVGLFGSTNHPMVFSTNNTERMRILSTGQIRFNGYTSTSSFPGTAAGFIGFDSSGNLITVASAGGVGGSGTTNYVARWTASTTLGTGVLYDDGTNVGIGTTSPGYKLHVTDTGLFQSNSSSGRVLRLRDNAGNGGNIIQFEDNSSTEIWEVVGRSSLFYIYKNTGTGAGYKYEINSNGDHEWSDGKMVLVHSSGNVGIGTTSPDSKFHMGPSNGSQIRFDYAGSGDNYYDGVTHYFRNGSGATNVMTLLNGGNVGIGTTTPSYPLHVRSSGVYHITAEQSSTNTGDTGAYATFYVINNAGASQLRGFFGAGGNSVGNTAMQNHIYVGSQSNHGVRFFTNDSVKMTLTADGNFGVGSTSPDGRLYVERTATWSSGNLVGTNTYQVITYGSGASPGTVTINAIGAYQQSTFTGSATIGNGGRHGAIDSILSIGNTSSGTITLTQASTIRALSSISAATYYNPTSTTTITHLAGIRVLPDINVGAGAVTVTNKYGILIGDASGGTGSITYTTRWGIYQEGASDNNYFAAKVLIGTTTATSDALYVNGTAYINNNLTVNGTVTELSSANYKRNINTLENTLEKVDKMRAVSYNRVGGVKKEIGLIAEEVEQVYPEFVEYDNNGRPMGLNYARLTAVLLQSIKELNGRINELENRN